MTATTDEVLFATHLRALLLATPYSRASSLKVLPGPVRKASEKQGIPGAVPDECIFVLATGGLTKQAFCDGGAKGGILRPTFQVTVRGKVRDYDGGAALAVDAMAAIDMQPPTGFIDCRAQGSSPFYINEDDQNHHQWTFNLWCKRH